MTMLRDGTPREAGMDPDRIAMLHERAPTWVDGHRMRSGVLLAARRGKIVFHEAFGPLTWEPGSPALQKDSIFRVASITKPVTATAAMVLVEEGRLGLNRPIKEYLPEVCGEGTDDVEVQHLLTHTSGFEDDDEAEFCSELAASLATNWSKPAGASPGSKMSYADHNFNLLGEIVCRVSGQPLEAFVKARLFEPLDMVDTTYIQQNVPKNRYAVRREGIPVFDGAWGADGLHITALDLARFGQMFLSKGKAGSRQVLSAASVREMTRNQIPGVGTDFLGFHEEASWGLGWTVQDNERWTWSSGSLTPRGTFSHMGAGGHYIWVDPVHEVVGVILSACMDIDMDTMVHRWNLDLFQNMVTAAAID